MTKRNGNTNNLRKYHPVHKVGVILRDKIKQYKKCCDSLWNYNEKENTIVIYTTGAGYWIGKAGQDVAKLKDDLNFVIKEHNAIVKDRYPDEKEVPLIKGITFVECSN